MGDVFNYLCVNGGELGLPIRFNTGVTVPEMTEPRFHPVPVSQKKINEWWWQAKDWFLDTDFRFTDSLGNTFTLPSQVLTNQNALVVRELNLITGSNYAVGEAHTFGTTAASLGISFLTEAPVISGAFLYPSILIQGGLDNGLGEGVQLNSINFNSFTPSINSGLDGIAVPLYSSISGGGSFSVTKFNLTVNSTWPYT